MNTIKFLIAIIFLTTSIIGAQEKKYTSYIVKEGETILIESGSVNVLLARELLKIRKVTIITTNVYSRANM